ncbi:MAG: hypothetical protein AABX16_05590 [Nanoarchaeota archaeon]
MKVINVSQTIQSAEKGSQIYALTEKIAYYFHTENASNPADQNWCTAQDYLEDWLDINYEIFPCELEELFKRIVNTANVVKNENDTLYDIGQKIIHSNRIFMQKKH